MKIPIIWKKLLLEKRRIVLSREIRDLAKKINKNERWSVDYLQRHGYIVRVFRGIYYIKSADERQMGTLDFSIYEIVAMALKEKGVKDWYFGLETALKLNNMTHEYYAVNYVITNTYKTTKIINILDTKIKFLKWNDKHFKFGIIKKGKLRYSDKEKTILDIAYRVYRKKSKHLYVYNIVGEYRNLIDNRKLMEYFEHYPIRFQRFLGDKT
jgi:predicted transcriptional regulator of viral defense system